jgi:DNA helicase II / ATP-dependent DNA helicase PcrA
VDYSKLRQVKPQGVDPTQRKKPTEEQLRRLRKIKPTQATAAVEQAMLYHDLTEGVKVSHERFGRGVVKAIVGIGAEKKAEIEFETGGIKTLLLRFAKLSVLN